MNSVSCIEIVAISYFSAAAIAIISDVAHVPRSTISGQKTVNNCRVDET